MRGNIFASRLGNHVVELKYESIWVAILSLIHNRNIFVLQ